MMHMRRGTFLAISVTAALVAALTATTTVAAADGASTLRQVGTFEALVQPNFAGLAPLNAATQGATLGLGTFANLDGEYVLVAGQGYRVPTSGVPVRVSGQEMTPFVQAVRFVPTHSAPVPPGTQCSQLTPIIDALAKSSDGIVSVRLRGTFTALTMRSVPAQQEPWPSLATVIANQSQFILDGKRAVLVGFRQGPDFLGVGQPGLHLHGLTADRTGGGHVLSCTVGADAQLSIQRVASVSVQGVVSPDRRTGVLASPGPAGD